jgi:hypothetical protein
MSIEFPDDRYQLGDPIGRGLTAQVFRARDMQKTALLLLRY